MYTWAMEPHQEKHADVPWWFKSCLDFKPGWYLELSKSEQDVDFTRSCPSCFLSRNLLKWIQMMDSHRIFPGGQAWQSKIRHFIEFFTGKSLIYGFFPFNTCIDFGNFAKQHSRKLDFNAKANWSNCLAVQEKNKNMSNVWIHNSMYACVRAITYTYIRVYIICIYIYTHIQCQLTLYTGGRSFQLCGNVSFHIFPNMFFCFMFQVEEWINQHPCSRYIFSAWPCQQCIRMFNGSSTSSFLFCSTSCLLISR